MKNTPDAPAAAPYGKKAVIFAVLATVSFIISAVFAAYGMVCPTSSGICLPDSVNSIISGTAVFLLTAGVLLGIAGILFAVESIAVMEKATKSYIALAVLLVSVLGMSGDVFKFLILKAVGNVFQRSY